MNKIDFAQALQTGLGLILDSMPGVSGFSFRRYRSGEALHLDADREDVVAACAKLFGAKLEIVTLESGGADGQTSKWWRRARRTYEGLMIEISGPHYDGTPSKLDADEIAEATMQASAMIVDAEVANADPR